MIPPLAKFIKLRTRENTEKTHGVPDQMILCGGKRRSESCDGTRTLKGSSVAVEGD